MAEVKTSPLLSVTKLIVDGVLIPKTKKLPAVVELTGTLREVVPVEGVLAPTV